MSAQCALRGLVDGGAPVGLPPDHLQAAGLDGDKAAVQVLEGVISILIHLPGQWDAGVIDTGEEGEGPKGRHRAFRGLN